MSYRAQFAVHCVALLIFSLCPLLLLAQDNPQGNQPGAGRTVQTPLQVLVTGCLKKDAETGGFYITDANGRTWELTSSKVDLVHHVYHTVSVSGHPAPTAVPQGKGEAAQKPTGGQPRISLDVVELIVISPSCTR